MQRLNIAITALVGAALLGFAGWCIALLSEVSQLRSEVERRVHWLAELQELQADLADPRLATDPTDTEQRLSELDRVLLAEREPSDPVAVRIAATMVELRALQAAPDDQARRAAVGRGLAATLAALRAENAGLSEQLGTRWLHLQIVAISAIAMAAGMLGLLGYAVLVAGPKLRADAARLAALSVRLEQASLAGRGVGHELGSPLTSALTTLQLLRDELRGAGESRQEHIRMLEQAIAALNRATGTLQDLRASSDSGDEQTTDVHVALDEALAATRFRQASASRVTMDAERVAPIGLPQPMVRSLFTRILGGAAAADSADAIVVRTRQERELVSVEFGMPHVSARDDAFADVSRALGVLGGSLSVRREGGGGVVRVELPQRVVAPPPTPSPRPTTAGRVRILLIDDDESVLSSVARVLVRHEVVSESDPERAIERAIGGDFGLILCDMMMPKKSGVEVFRAVTAARPELAARFAFMSGGSVEPEIAAALDHAALRIDKPFGADELRRLVARFVEHAPPEAPRVAAPKADR